MALHVKHRRHPDWLRVKFPSGATYYRIKAALTENRVNTVCEEAKCPNVAECYGRGTVTFLIMGDVCTRKCSYCNIHSGIPEELDRNEPGKI
ncbi:MAG: lipoyl synthase, partial [Candidatus Marinimicrobia bacterium]|nr:lipoyl synthase [Candidatus Neomarinimicrobiota bacterium]